MEIKDVVKMAAFKPAYCDGVGQGLEVYFRDGTTGWLNLSLRSTLTRMTNLYAVNMQEARRRFAPILGQKNLIPVVLEPHLVFIPIKCRTPLVGGDSAYGYFRLRSILAVKQVPEPCTLVIEGSHHITVKQSYRRVLSRINSARKLESHLMEQYLQTWDELQVPVRHADHGMIAVSPVLYNMMEVMVRKQLDEVLRIGVQSVCLCELCRLRMAAQALNQLPAHYVAVESELVPKLKPTDRRFQLEVNKAVVNAVKAAGKSNCPSHKAD